MEVSMHSLGLDKLPEVDRLRLAQELIDSVPYDDGDDMTAERWADIERRLADMDESPGSLLDGDEVLARWRQTTLERLR